MIAALEGVSGQQHAPAEIYPRKRPCAHFTGDFLADRLGNMLPLQGKLDVQEGSNMSLRNVDVNT